MRIAFVSPDLGGGGAERATVNLVNGLAEQNETEVFLITAAKAENEYCYSTKAQRICAINKHLLSDVLALRRVLKTHQIDIAVGMGLYANFCICMANCGITTKMVISERNAPAQDHISWKSRLLRMLVYRYADAYVFQTPGARAFYSRAIQRRGVVIPNPIKADLPERSVLHKKEIVAAGRLAPQKNYPVLLKAFSEVCKKNQEYMLRIFGQGPAEYVLRDLCDDLGISHRVVFEGFCDDVHEKMKNADIYVLTSDFEGMPNALMEAMAMGFPVVSTDCPPGGPRMLIHDGENGLLCPVGDVQKLAEAILRLINHPEEKEKMANNAKRISNVYSMKNILLRWKNFFEEII